MAREYWVETGPTGKQRYVKAVPLRRRNTHDGSQSSRSRRVDFLDVTREEYTSLLERERVLRQSIEDLRRENYTYKTNWQACDEELRQLQSTLGQLEYENHQLREGHSHRGSRDREEDMRKLRNRNTRLRNENDTLLARIRSLERELRDGVSERARRLAEELAKWKRRYSRAEDDAERLQHKLVSVSQRNHKLAMVNESLAREDRKLRREVETYEAILRRHGLR